MIHVTPVRVRYGETDQMGVVYHAEYLVYCEIGRTEFIRALGLPYAEMERRGVKLAVTDASLRFHAAATYDDELLVTTRLVRAGSRGVTFDYVITHAASGRRLVAARTALVALGAGGRPAPMPGEMRALLERVVVPEA